MMIISDELAQQSSDGRHQLCAVTSVILRCVKHNIQNTESIIVQLRDEIFIRKGLGFMVSPNVELRSSSCPGIFSMCRRCNRVVKNTNISRRAKLSPRQRRIPMPNIITFSVTFLFRWPDSVRNRSGRKASGSPQMSLFDK